MRNLGGSLRRPIRQSMINLRQLYDRWETLQSLLDAPHFLHSTRRSPFQRNSIVWTEFGGQSERESARQPNSKEWFAAGVWRADWQVLRPVAFHCLLESKNFYQI